MKLLRYKNGDKIKPGILDNDDLIHDASSLVSDWDNTSITNQKINSILDVDVSALPLATELPINREKIAIASCLPKSSVGKFICIGLNYSDHAEETGMKVPPEPIMFMKATSAICGPNDDVIFPKNSLNQIGK